MKRKCDVCRIESDDYWMYPYNIGIKTVWLCWDCYRESQREAALSDFSRQRKLYKIHESKRRTK